MTPVEIPRLRWFLIFWLFVLSAVGFLDRVNIAIAGSSLASAYHLSKVQLGLVFSAFLAGYALFQTPGGRLVDRWGARRVLAGGVLWWGAFTALTGSIPLAIRAPLVALVVVRFLLGAGEAVVYPASNLFVAHWIPPRERGVANGWIFAGVGVGAGLSPPLITYLMVHYGWRTSFWACACVGLMAGLVWFLVARDRPLEHPHISPAELELIRSSLVAGAGSAPRQALSATKGEERLIAWATLLRSRDVRALTLSYFCFGYVAWIFFSWFYIYLAEVRGLDLKSSAFYAMLPFIAMAVGCPLGGTVSDRLARTYGFRSGRCYLAAAALACAAVFLVMGAQVEGAKLASVVLAGGAGALYFAQSSFWSVTSEIAGSSSGSVSGFMNMGAQIGGAVTASLTPAIAGRFGWAASFMVAAGFCLLGSGAWLLIEPGRVLLAAAPAASERRPPPSLGASRRIRP